MLTARTMFELFHEEPNLNWERAKRDLRRSIAESVDPLTIPIRRTFKEMFTLPWRTVFPGKDCWDYWKEFCIVTDTEFTDEELDELIRENWIHINSPYDCTGRVFTSHLSAIRIPCGTLFIHCKGVDV